VRQLALLAVVVLGACATPTRAAPIDEILAAYAQQARSADARFAGFSAERGCEVYFREHELETGEVLSCAACHHEDPRTERYAHQDPIPCVACHRFQALSSEGMLRIRRQFLPLAPSANPDRFTDPAFVEKWFRINCRMLMQRECTPLEKGDVITWLLTFR
jgi:hypothetical protein